MQQHTSWFQVQHTEFIYQFSDEYVNAVSAVTPSLAGSESPGGFEGSVLAEAGVVECAPPMLLLCIATRSLFKASWEIY